LESQEVSREETNEELWVMTGKLKSLGMDSDNFLKKLVIGSVTFSFFCFFSAAAYYDWVSNVDAECLD
jgi:hypothetical protein